MNIITKDTKQEISVDEKIFNREYNEGLVHQTVNAVLNAYRSGNSAQKTRSEVRGGGKKPWNQKGSGRARAGTIRSPIWRSGGVTFASKKRSYTQKLNKKMYKAALSAIFSELLRQERLHVVENIVCEEPKTKAFLKLMNSFNVNNALILVHDFGETEYLASRNLPQFDICDVEFMDPYSLLRFEHVLITSEALKQVEELLQ
ncbi:MAG TPA: 50S ribosomal protein L4 [Legionellales bacterium]|jgi:large subunit ribosomal protein L4|nr:50S ribosomal protein L4 [Legionellales bacterium]